MIIENPIADAIDFFHVDAYSADVPMQVDVDIQPDPMDSSLYRILARASATASRPPTPVPSSARPSAPAPLSRSHLTRSSSTSGSEP